MTHVQLGSSDGTLIVTMARGKANAFNAEMLNELLDALDVAARDSSVRALVLASNRPRFFSAGFDVMEVFAYEREAMTAFFGRYIDLYEGLRALPKPVVGAVSGHAFAGGAIIALACDARVLSDGDAGFAVNEVNFGVIPPPGFLRLALAAAGEPATRRMVLEGKVLTPAEALACGLASELAPEADVLPRALALAKELASKPPITFAGIKSSLARYGARTLESDRELLPTFIEHWFSPECSTHRMALTKSLRR